MTDTTVTVLTSLVPDSTPVSVVAGPPANRSYTGSVASNSCAIVIPEAHLSGITEVELSIEVQLSGETLTSSVTIVPNDIAPGLVSTSISQLTSTSVRISAELIAGAPLRIRYYPTSSPGSVQYSAEETSSTYGVSVANGGNGIHQQNISGLTSDTEYTYFCQSSDNAGVSWYDISGAITFSTLVGTAYPPQISTFPSSAEANISAPALGASVAGDLPGFIIRRVSNDFEIHSYSSRAAITSDNTKVLLPDGDSVKIRRISDGALLSDIAGVNTELSASHVDANVAWGITGGKVRKVNISGGTVAEWMDAEGATQMGNFEGAISKYDERMVVNTYDGSTTYHLKVLDLVNKTIIGRRTISSLNGAKISHDGNHLCWVSNGTLYVSTVNFSSVINTGLNSYHGDTGVDANGNQVFVRYSTTNGDIQIVNMATGGITTRTLGGDLAYTGHISCRNVFREGWAYISAYGGTRLFALKLDLSGPLVFEDWGRSRSDLFEGGDPPIQQNYYDAAKGVVSVDGKMFMYTSKWNVTTNRRNYITEYTG